jgi:ArsR family transcriptional regulator, lead/cadmium/zinc/bismuth-responsive transcriptional repressor
MENLMDKVDDTCLVECVHSDNVERVNAKMESDDNLFELAELFKAFGDSTRIRILHALSFSELCVCDLAQLLNMSSSAVSHQLRVLRGQKIVKYRKDGKNVIYSLVDSHVSTLMEQGLQHVKE